MNGRALNEKAIEVSPSSSRVLDRAAEILTPWGCAPPGLGEHAALLLCSLCAPYGLRSGKGGGPGDDAAEGRRYLPAHTPVSGRDSGGVMTPGGLSQYGRTFG